MVYKELIGAGAGATLFYIVTGNFWATLFGGLFGCYVAEKCHNDYKAPNQTASIDDLKGNYPAYVS